MQLPIAFFRLHTHLRPPTAELNVVEGFGRRLIQFEDVTVAGFLDKR